MFSFIPLAWLGSIVKAIASLVSSLAPNLSRFVSWFQTFVEVLWEGFIDVLDNWKTIVFVSVLAFTVGFSTSRYYITHPNCKKVIVQLHKDYKFIPKSKKEKTSSHPQSEWWKVFN